MCDLSEMNIAELTIDTVMTIALGPGLGLYLVPDSWFSYLRSFLNARKQSKENDEDENDGEDQDDENVNTNERNKKRNSEYMLTKSALSATLSFIDDADENSKQIKAACSLEDMLGLKEDSGDSDKRSSRESSVSSLLNFVPTYFNGSSIVSSIASSLSNNNKQNDDSEENDTEIDEFEIVNEIDILAMGTNEQQQQINSSNKKDDEDDKYTESAL